MNKSELTKGNNAFREQNYEKAIHHYKLVTPRNEAIKKLIEQNISFATAKALQIKNTNPTQINNNKEHHGIENKNTSISSGISEETRPTNSHKTSTVFRQGTDAFMLRVLRPSANIAIAINCPTLDSWQVAMRIITQVPIDFDLFVLGNTNKGTKVFPKNLKTITLTGPADEDGNGQNFLRLSASNVFDYYKSVFWIMINKDSEEEITASLKTCSNLLSEANYGLLGSKKSKLIEEKTKTAIKTVLPRLGITYQEKINFCIDGDAIWINTLLLRGLCAAISPSEISNGKSTTGFPGRDTILSALTILSHEAGLSTELQPTPTTPKEKIKNRSLKAISFYLPQFHPIPENDLWWGKGFTEWTNVTRAKQLFRSHYQPRVPTELGYYDLRLEETQIAQANLANEFGIHGFCFYYYWFDGKKLLNKPIEQMFQSKNIETGFCVCWANENWSRNWDGQNRHVLLEQTYTLESNIELIRELIPMMKDPRWIRHQGKPVMMVYRISIIPNWLETSKAWREECKKAGLGEIHLCAVRFGKETLHGTPKDHNLDSYVLFPPHESARLDLRKEVKDLHNQFRGEIFDYKTVVEGDLDTYKDGYQWPVHRGVMMGWDNTARRLTDARVFHGATPYGFRSWIKGILEQEQSINECQESLLFINAWNEWAEGTYLEPDQRWGRGYLQAFASAIEATPGVKANLVSKEDRRNFTDHKLLDKIKGPNAGDFTLPSWHPGSREHNINWPTIMLCAHIAGHQLFGGERSLLDVLASLSKLEVNVVMTLPATNNKKYIEEICKLSLGVHCFHYSQWKENREEQAWLTTTFANIIASHAVDVIHANTIVLLEPLKAAVRMHRTRVVHARELISLDDPLREKIGLGVSDILSHVYSNSDWIIGNSQATKNLFSRPNKTHYVPNAVTIEDFDLNNKFGNTLKFGIVSSNIPKKGVSDFVEVAQKMATIAPRAKFIIIGPINEQIKKWQAEIEKGTRPNNLSIAGYYEHPRKAMSEINVLLNLSHFAESFGRTVAEAMAARRPVIAYDWGALGELVQHEKTGILVPYRDINGVIDAVLKFCENDKLIIKMGESGRDFINRNFTQQNLYENLKNAYEEILKDAKKKSTNANFIASQSIGLPPKKTTIIIPVYNAPQETINCINSVLKHTDFIHNRLLIINDGSPDPSIVKILNSYENTQGITILHNEANIGYTKTINKGIRECGSDDVILLNSDTIVTPRWLEGLRCAAYSEPKVGTVTAMSDNAGAFSFPKFNEYCPRPVHLSNEDYALLLTQQTRNSAPPEVPTGSGFCMYIRRSMMNECGLFDPEGFPRGYGEENDFCMRSMQAGWKNLISPWSFVYHIRTASFKGEKAQLVQAGVNVVTKRYPNYARLVKEAFSNSKMIELRNAAERRHND